MTSPAGRRFFKATLAMAVGALLALTLTKAVESARFDKAPEFPSQSEKDWIGPPQSMKALAGKVVILDVWTFG